MNEQEQRERTYGRRITVEVRADSMNELEMAALDEARAYFGSEVQLEVLPNYHVHAYGHGVDNSNNGKRYHANVMVAELAP